MRTKRRKEGERNSVEIEDRKKYKVKTLYSISIFLLSGMAWVLKGLYVYRNSK
jgi:hypothetical protein